MRRLKLKIYTFNVMCKCMEFDFIQAGLRKVTLDIHRAGKRSRMSACGFLLGVKCLQSYFAKDP